MRSAMKPGTVRGLKESGYRILPVKLEMEKNLLQKLENHDNLFPGIQGYDETVIPQIVNAILAHQDIVFLGERGQAKSRLMRSMISFLDPEIPYVAGCEIHDHPLQPVCYRCRKLVAEKGDETPLEWLDREHRYGERLSPGTKIGDLIGDLDPAKVAGGSPLASEDALHFGLIPRMNRGIVAINELPDLDYLIQVSLFNILEERDVQIRGYPIRFNLDVSILFTANPEDYNRSGRIIPQIKDRIGAEIRTHYPLDRENGMKIMEQEARIFSRDGEAIQVPDFMKKIVEQITMEARRSPYVNQKAGVSARLSIANYETMIANARRRAILLNEAEVIPRMSDLNYLYTSSTGKVELDPFREETMTEFQVMTRIFEKAIQVVFLEYFGKESFDGILEEFQGSGKMVQVSDLMPAGEYSPLVGLFPHLWEPLHILGGEASEALKASCIEFVLEGLSVTGKLTRRKSGDFIAYRSREPS